MDVCVGEQVTTDVDTELATTQAHHHIHRHAIDS